MATSSDLNTLSGLAKCFRCLSDAEARALTVYLLDQIAQGSGGGGGGGGAVTIADGADVAEGAKADARAGSPDQASASVIALLRAVFQQTLSSSQALANIVIDTDALVAGVTIAGGNIGGYTTVIKSAVVVTAAAYSAGNAVGALRTLTNAVRTPGTGILQSVTLLDRANQKQPMTLFIFDSNPAAATITDKAAFVFSTDDLKVIAQVNIGAGDYTTTNSKAIANLGGLAIPLKAASGTTLYAVLVTSGTPTFAATTDVQLEVGILQD
ncbi:hypothetical protein KW797_04860 [Candidatus Parcubacteria bacterium]|nr:hypothetical protein [Candidatus Parcubacteria bacterium]